MIDNGTAVRVSCDKCGVWLDVDLTLLVEAKGRDYSLIDRRCRCRITEGCPGWNRFYALWGIYRPLWSDETTLRWMRTDRRDRGT